MTFSLLTGSRKRARTVFLISYKLLNALKNIETGIGLVHLLPHENTFIYANNVKANMALCCQSKLYTKQTAAHTSDDENVEKQFQCVSPKRNNRPTHTIEEQAVMAM